jgi:signal transduction histidine kinase
MNLWDMTFPLRVNHTLIGVLCAGQIIVSDHSVEWGEALRELTDMVDWASVPGERSYQVDDVCEAIKSRALSEHRGALAQMVREDPDNKNVPVSKLLTRFAGFIRFGKMMQGLLGELYSLKVRGAEQTLLNQMAIQLARGTTTYGNWWQVLQAVVSEFRDAAAIGPVDVFYGEATRYVQRIGPGGVLPEDCESTLPVHLGALLPADHLVSPRELDATGIALEGLPLNVGDLLFKTSLALLEGQRISMIFVIRGVADQPDKRRFIDDFCRMLGLRASLSEVLFQISADRDEFAKRVRTVSHSTRTPLQLALIHIRRAREEAERLAGGEELQRYLDQARLAVLQAKAENAEIYPAVGRKRQHVSLKKMLKGIVGDMEPLAAEKRCQLVLRLPPGRIVVRVREPEMRVALRNLLDNAIKFSYNDHEIRVTMRRAGTDTVEIVFSNYGIGIPPDKLLLISREGGRARVRDPMRPPGWRPGTGLGVPIAIRYLQAEGGTLDISSRPTVAEDRLEYHNYLTLVSVTLPLSSFQGDSDD